MVNLPVSSRWPQGKHRSCQGAPILSARQRFAVSLRAKSPASGRELVEFGHQNGGPPEEVVGFKALFKVLEFFARVH